MISLLKIILKILPWLLVVGMLSWWLLEEKIGFERIKGDKEVYQQTILNRVEHMGKLELVKYSFQEVTEIKQMADVIDLKIFKFRPLLFPDSKAVLISQGSATGCIDLSQLSSDHLIEKSDTLFVQLPLPEMCYFKIDLEKSRIYDLQVNYMSADEQKAFIQELYRVAEEEIRQTA